MKKRLLTITALLLAGIATFAQDSDAPSLGVGSEVSDYPQVQWIKGTPVSKFEKNKIYIVECWATWCHPCVQNIPHLNELSRKFDGKIIVIGQGVWEDDKAVVEKFVKEKGNEMSYNVAFSGGNESDFSQKWLKPAKVNGIPAAFVIQDNKIIWTPHPAEISEEALQLLVDHKFTLEAAKALSPYKKIEEAQRLLKENKLSEAEVKLDAILAKTPKSEEANAMKVELLRKQGKDAEALAFAKKRYDKYPKEGKDLYYDELMKAKDYARLLSLTAADLKETPEDPGTIVKRYEIFSAQKDYKSAAAMINKAAASNKEEVLTLLAMLNQYVPGPAAGTEAETAMLNAGKKGLLLKPDNFQLMLGMAKMQWKNDKASARATVAKSAEALKKDPKQARLGNVAAQLLESMNKDVFPENDQIEAWYKALNEKGAAK